MYMYVCVCDCVYVSVGIYILVYLISQLIMISFLILKKYFKFKNSKNCKIEEKRERKQEIFIIISVMNTKSFSIRRSI